MFKINRFRCFFHVFLQKSPYNSFASTGDIFFPVVDCQLKCSYLYNPRYVLSFFAIFSHIPRKKVSRKASFKIAEKKGKNEANSATIKKFLINQLKNDQINIKNTKEVKNMKKTRKMR